jgi:putative tryptophan/tyrosine transport system substrate-binding protein
MRRREFIALLGGAAAVPALRPRTARAQQASARRISVLMMYPENDPEARLRVAAFEQGLGKAGWMPGRNLQINYQWGVGDADWVRGVTADMLKQSPDVLVANGGAALRTVRLLVSTVPIVFIGTSEPVAQGIITSLAHPGGNITGFSNIEPTMGAKWLELLKEVAPNVARVTLMFHVDNDAAVLLTKSAAEAAPRFGVDISESRVSDAAGIEAAMTKFGSAPGGGLILPPEPFTAGHRKLIVGLAERNRLPTISAVRSIALEGGLMSYGVNLPDLFRQAAEYVSRILRGEKPADLPVQQPTRFEMLVNLRAAKALGLTIPTSILLRADEVIE